MVSTSTLLPLEITITRHFLDRILLELAVAKLSSQLLSIAKIRCFVQLAIVDFSHGTEKTEKYIRFSCNRFCNKIVDLDWFSVHLFVTSSYL